MKKLLTLSVLMTSLLLIPVFVSAQAIKLMSLKDAPMAYRIKHFKIASVVDARRDKSSLGSVQVGAFNKWSDVDLKGGVAAAIAGYLDRNLRMSADGLPIMLYIDNLYITETAGGLSERVDLEYKYSFYNQDTKLIEYSGTGYMTSGWDVTKHVENLIRQSLERSTQDFDKWLGDNPVNAAPQSVKVIATTAGSTNNANYILYNKGYKLTGKDFEGEVDDLSLAAASTYSGVLMNQRSETLGKDVKVQVTVMPVFDRSKSWINPKTGNNARVMAHERTHFAITALLADELVKMINEYTFSLENYAAELENLHKVVEQSWQDRQKQFDRDTKHGTVASQEAAWEKQIASELSNKGL